MPCHDPGYSSSSEAWNASNKADEAAKIAREALEKAEELNKKVKGSKRVVEENDYLKKRLDEVTAHLCYTLRAVRRFAPDVEKEVVDMNPLLKKWWEEHQEYDRKREEK
jgi:hypothetical protein